MATDDKTEAFYSQFDTMAHGGKVTSDLYSGWSRDYEHDNLSMTNSYQHPVKIAQVAAEYLSDKGCRILDVCAGTGLGGAALAELGYTNVDAIDGSEGMLEVAKQKKIYKNVYCEIIDDVKIKTAPSGAYDAIVTSGSFLPGHLGPKQLRVLAEVLKPNAYFCMALRTEYLETDYLADLLPEMLRMENDGIWVKVKHDIMPQYYNDLPGTAFIYRKC